MIPARRRNVRRFCVNVAVALIAGLLPCVGAEALLRALALPADTPDLFPKLSSELEWSGRPSSRGRHAGVPVSFNRFGLRDRDRSIERAPDTIRIIVLGDSMTFGMGVVEEATFPRVAEGLLNMARPRGQPSVEVLNFGLPGYNTLHQLAQLKELGLAFRPDLVVVAFFYNDVELSTAQTRRLARTAAGAAEPAAFSRIRRAWSEVGAGVSSLQHQSVLYGWAAARLGAMIRQLGMRGFGQTGKINDQYLETSPNWELVRLALVEMKSLSQQNNTQFVIAVVPAMAKFTESGYPVMAYHEAVSSFCRAQSIPCLDLLPAFWGQDGTKFWISLTDGHPDARGHRIMADALAKFLAPRLPQRPVVAMSDAAR